MPKFNINYKNAPGERLIDKTAYLIDVNTRDSNKNNFVVFMKGIIENLRNIGSVEPKDFIITENFKLNKDNIEIAQNYQSLPKLLQKLHEKFPLTPPTIDSKIRELLDAAEKYINANWASEDDRKLMREGGEKEAVTGIITEIKRLIDLSEQNKFNANNLRWSFKTEIAHLWACAQAEGIEKEFISVFTGLNACEWGRLVQIYVPLNKAIMGHGNNETNYTTLAAKISPVVQNDAIEILKMKLIDGNILNKVLVKAFLDFVECRNELGGPIAENWSREAQMVFGAFNEAFSRKLPEILDKPMNGLVESYHFYEFFKCIVSAITSEPESYEGPMTNMLFEAKQVIAEEFLAKLATSDEPSKIIEEFKQTHKTMLDLRVVSKESFDGFYKIVPENTRVEILKLISKLSLEAEVTKFVQENLYETQKQEFSAAVQSTVNGNKSLIETFGKEWILNKEIFNEVTKDIKYCDEQELVFSAIKAYCKKMANGVPLSLAQQWKAAKVENVKSLVGKMLEKPKESEAAINEFITKHGSVDLTLAPIEMVLQLLKTADEALIYILTKSEKISISWDESLGGKYTLLSELYHVHDDKYANHAVELYKTHEAEWADKLCHDMGLNGEVTIRFGELM